MNLTEGENGPALNDCLRAYASTPIGLLYPCDVCRPTLKAAPNDYATDAPVRATGVGDALQYCALVDLLHASDVAIMNGAGWGVGDPCDN